MGPQKIMEKLLISNGARKISLLILIIFFSVSFLSLLPWKIQAQSQVCPADQEQSLVPCARDCNSQLTYWDDTQPCQLCHLFYMFQGVVNFFLFRIIPVIAVLMLVIGGALFIFSAGSPSNVTRAKSVITATVIGLVIVYASWLIINTFFIFIGVSSWTGLATGWFRIDCPITP